MQQTPLGPVAHAAVEVVLEEGGEDRGSEGGETARQDVGLEGLEKSASLREGGMEGGREGKREGGV